jgi:hypothetical protein
LNTLTNILTSALRIALLCGVLFVCLTPKLHAQKRVQLYITPMLGTVYYVGDLKDHALPGIRHMRPFYGADLKLKWKTRFSLGIGWFRGKLVGADQWGIRNNKRDFRFRSKIDDIHLLLRINPKFWKSKVESLAKFNKNFRPYLVFGAAYFHHNPEIFAPGEGWNYASGIGTEGQHLATGDYPEPYKLWTWNVKYGVEFDFPINRTWSWQLYGFYNHTFTDYLDDVSKVYPHIEDLQNSTDGELIAAYAFRYEDGYIPPGGARRGNPLFRDGYVITGVSVSYLFRGQGPVQSHAKRPPRCVDWRKGGKRFALKKVGKKRKSQ